MTENVTQTTAALFLREKLPMTDEDFAFISRLVGARAGINLTDRKRELVYGRISSRIRALGLRSFRDYRDRLADDDDELVHCVNALTTNVTRFFREPHHFEFLTDWFHVREAQAARGECDRRIRIWSAGCSSGEEPYTIAITLLAAGLSPSAWDLEVLATDIDTNMLGRAARGVYKETAVDAVPSPGRWFLRGAGEQSGLVRVKPELRRLLTIRPLNLFEDWDEMGQFDLVFCRNVIIYFTSETRLALLERVAGVLPAGGYLVLGHSESVHGLNALFEPVGRTINRRRP